MFLCDAVAAIVRAGHFQGSFEESARMTTCFFVARNTPIFRATRFSLRLNVHGTKPLVSVLFFVSDERSEAVGRLALCSLFVSAAPSVAVGHPKSTERTGSFLLSSCAQSDSGNELR